MSRFHGAFGLLALTLSSCTTVLPPAALPPAAVMTKAGQATLTPDQALADLREGNRRFATGARIERDYAAQVTATAHGQYPKAAVLSCLDSRVPVEILFDQGIGDLFGVRVAGNVESDELIGSLEYACAVAGAKAVVVLGHTSCGAVKGAIDREEVAKLGLENLDDLLEALVPAVGAASAGGEGGSSDDASFVDQVASENVRLTIARIRAQSPPLARLEREGRIRFAGAVYDIATGRVRWLDEGM